MQNAIKETLDKNNNIKIMGADAVKFLTVRRKPSPKQVAPKTV
jgi:hypothetical protein